MKKYDLKDRDPITSQIISVCYGVHNELGPGFVERIYANALKTGFKKIGLTYQAEVEFPVLFEKEKVGKFRVDFLIDNKVILEVKAVTGILPKIFESQVISYLKASKLKVGLLVNFGNRSCVVRRLMFSKESP